ncbi:Glycosyltransferase, GT2 family [Geodermatophilus telluris]|uniref:Glycosyltransferase, GT2 family n=1 Tax=Geodermatophilus telluris TaxID=1190417 RepID=A0A1G6LW44_9ACTN|nr:glycosyltransferase [Geodermatophilus telluris]SDC47450.1 Glycosyltransferase, GT2 family [Geodermatophilus telluris]
MPEPRAGLDDVDVVLLVHREPPALLARHHAALAAVTGPGWRGRVLLVENAAAPATSAAARAELATRYPDAEKQVLSAPRNLGFARAMDLALSACTGRYALLVNSDGEPEPRVLHRLAEVLDAEPRAVWAAPAVHGPGEDDDPPGPPFEAAELGGTALLVRRAEFLAAGGFDPLYFFYNEDRDASRRLRAAGHLLLRVPDVRFRHGKEGRTARGVFLREWHYARTVQVLRVQHADRPLRAMPSLLAGRVRAVAAHLRDGDLPGAAGIALAALELPRGLLAAAARRRRPWDGARLATWLDRNRLPVTQLSPSSAAPSRSR